ncbi:MFS transporter [Streptomyces sp. KM273126]|uniref:MFS transporter n=1 Tax=Streptomyces sp. KM273126 TaxID=2545247 RepID=UPI00103F7754|nr:MFS transporter [Streptomyces sp. KM273126]MBA2811236.1 MFS transporter [Streptomyces sp. KM273126]
MTVTLGQRRIAAFALFFLPGLAMASWVTRTPDVRDLLGASTGRMGLVLFGLSVGSMAGILCSGPLVARWGARPVIAAGTLATAAGSGVIGLGAAAGTDAVVALGLGLIGLGMGGGEVALNVEGAEVERLLGRSALPAMHGFYSLGTVVGAVGGMILTAIAFPVMWHLAVVAAVVLAVLVPMIRYVPSGVGRRTGNGSDMHAQASPRPAVWREPRLLLIGGIILALAMAEGTANDWLPLVMVDGHGFDPALGSAVYAAFAASMTVGRFAGGRFIDRYGRAAALCASAVIGAVGIALVILVDNQAVAAAAAVLWGIGASLGFPVALSAAGDSGDNSAARVSLAATVGYVAFLVGPPSLGHLGEQFGLRNALFLVLILVVAASFATPAARAASPVRTP